MKASGNTLLHIAFDLDNTLIQSLVHKREAVYATLYRHVSKHELWPFGEAFVKRTDELAKGLPGRAHGWQRHLGLPESWIDEIYAEAGIAMINEVVNACQPDAIVIRGLEALNSQGHILALHSHGHKNYCMDIVESMGLRSIFPERNIYHKGRVPFYKTDVQAHRFVQASLHDQYGDNAIDIMVDDMVENLLAAHYAGAKTVLNGTPLPADVTQIDFNYPHIHQTLDALNTFTPDCLFKMAG